MEIQPDFRELLKLLHNEKVEYIIVGAYALAFLGVPRYTGDLDLYIKPEKDNAKKIVNALEKYGFGSLGLSARDFENPGKIIQLGSPPARIDIITSISGVNWEDAKTNCLKDKYGDISINYLGRKQFISNKRATGRKKDLADLEALGEE